MKNIALVLLILFNLACHAQTDKAFNLDFEKYDSDKNSAKGWFKWSDSKT